MKKNWKGQTAYKAFALLIACITGITTLLAAIMMIFSIGLRAEYGNQNGTIAELMQEHMVSNYAAYLKESATEEGGSWDALDGSLLTYAVEQIDFQVTGDGDKLNVVRNNNFVYGSPYLIQWLQDKNHREMDGVYENVFFDKNEYHYNTDTWLGAMQTNVYGYVGNDEVYLDESKNGDRLEYYDYDVDSEDADNIEENLTDEDNMSDDVENEGNNAGDLLAGELPPEGTYTFYRIYMIPNLEDVFLEANDTAQLTDEQQEVVKENYRDAAITIMGSFSYGKSALDSGNFFEVINRLQKYEDDLVFANGMSDYLWIPYILTAILTMLQKVYLPILLVSLLLFIVSFVFLMTMSGHRKEDDAIYLRWADRVPYGIYGIVVATGVCLGVIGNIGLWMAYYSGVLALAEFVTLSIVLAVLWTLLALAFCMSTATRIKSGQFWKHTLWHYIAAFFRKWLIDPIRRLHRAIHENTKLSTRLGLGLAILALVELMALLATGIYGAGVFLFFLYKIAETALIFYLVLMAKKLKDGGKRVASGNYNEPIDTTHMIAPMREHGEDINHVGEGIAIAVAEQMKSERFKTELITNVSHDIKTPLTSIINYVDLIKKEGISEEKVREYVEVLDRQSARLKKLIEDLLEASKASTGNVEMHMEPCDAAVMISQVVGEYQDKLQAQDIEIVVNEAKNPANIMADGRHLWRVFDNIMSNICKYTQDHTRVYVNVEDAGDQVRMIFKNISKYPLNISSDELMERFVRGDASRNTEGHGLGLSIASSLTALMDGQLTIDIDGDLFKITVAMKKQA